MSRQERFKNCIRCGKKKISPFLPGKVCGECIAEEQIQRIRG